MDFLANNALYVLTALAACVALFMAFRWTVMPVLQRLTALFFVAVVMHIWEESRFPGGFAELVTSKLGFTPSNPHFGDLILAFVVLVVVMVPILLPRVPFLSMAVMILGILEAVAHVAAIWVFKLDHFYSPGMVTAVFVLLPISVIGISYATRHHLMSAGKWALAVLYMFAPLIIGQQVVIAASGMSYSEFLKNIAAHF
jgi:hypothetical protein